MAIVHRAYTFDPQSFHAWLEAHIVEEDHVRIDKVHELAIAAVANASLTTRETLEWLRYDDEWLEMPGPDDDISMTHFWYMVLLAPNLSPAPALPGWALLRQALPIMGWTQEDVELLIRGDVLHTLLDASGNPLIIREFVGVDQFGGWLSLPIINRLQSQLLASDETLRAGGLSAAFEVICRLRQLRRVAQEEDEELWKMSPRLRAVSAEALRMLETAKLRNQALFLNLD